MAGILENVTIFHLNKHSIPKLMEAYYVQFGYQSEHGFLGTIPFHNALSSAALVDVGQNLSVNPLIAVVLGPLLLCASIIRLYTTNFNSAL